MELKNFLIANYGFNAWTDLMRIQRGLRQEQLEEKRRKARRRQRIMDMLGLGFASLLIASMVAGLVAWVVWLKGGIQMSAEDVARKLLELKILPRFMMLCMTGVYIRCIEWALSQPDLTTQQASLISVVTRDR